MSTPVWLGLLLAGVAGSLHCVGMCGPILLGFRGLCRPESAEPLPGGIRGLLSLGGEFLWYHAGRVSTYMFLGALASHGGAGLLAGSALVGGQRTVALVGSALVLASGIVLLGVVPGLGRERLASAVGVRWLGEQGWFRALTHTRTFPGRLLLGAFMGLLPCGLVYAALLVVAAHGRPGPGALGMLAFGLGTVPSLTAVLVGAGALPRALRAHGTRAAALVILLTGGFMLVRAWSIVPGTQDGTLPCGHPVPAVVAEPPPGEAR